MKAFKSYTDKQLRTLHRLLKEYAVLHDTETLHKIRVDIKRIKAALKLLGYRSPRFNTHRHYLPFRDIFRKANQIREPELMVKLLMAYKIEGIAGEHLLTARAPLITSFRKKIPSFAEKIRKSEETLQAPIRSVRVPLFRRYLKVTAGRIQKRLYPKPDFRSIHGTRKKIKQLIYLSAVYQGMRRKDYRFYRTIEQTIGQLHDKQVLVDFLRKHTKAVGSAAIKTLQDECLKDKKLIASLSRRFYR